MLDATEAAPPKLRVMQSTQVPCTITRSDGTIDAGTVRVVHPPGATVPERVDHKCGPTCGRCAS